MRIMRVPLDDSPPTPLCDVDPQWRSWAALHDGGIIAFKDQGKQYIRFDANGKASAPRQIDIGTLPGGLKVHRALPGDTAVLVTTYVWDNGFQEGKQVGTAQQKANLEEQREAA